jgi:phosphatidylglycerophosphate synthase
MSVMKEYKMLYKKYRKSIFDYYENSFFTSIYRINAILFFPLFKNISPNYISILSLLLGFTALFVFHFFPQLSLNVIVIFFLASYTLDFTDGIVARYQKKTSFNGRFMDGLFDIIVGGILHIIFFKSILALNNGSSLFFYLITILLHPMQHLVMDRYSALARWINEINKNKKLKPYYRNEFLGKYTKLSYDIQHLCIWCIFFNLFDNKIIIDVFFIFSFIASILSLGIHFFLSNKYFSSAGNQKDNREK